MINDTEIIQDDNGNYIFTPDQDYNGIAEIKYTIKGGASELMQTQYLMVTPVNDAPIAANNTIDVVMNEAHTFEITDFGFEDAIDNDRLNKVKLKVSDPENVRISGLPQSSDEIVITAQQIKDGLVTYKAGSIGIAKTVEFTVVDDGDISDSNSINESGQYIMTISGIPPAVNDEALLKSFQVKDAVKEIARSMSTDGSIPLENINNGGETIQQGIDINLDALAQAMNESAIDEFLGNHAKEYLQEKLKMPRNSSSRMQQQKMI